MRYILRSALEMQRDNKNTKRSTRGHCKNEISNDKIRSKDLERWMAETHARYRRSDDEGVDNQINAANIRTPMLKKRLNRIQVKNEELASSWHAPLLTNDRLQAAINEANHERLRLAAVLKSCQEEEEAMTSKWQQSLLENDKVGKNQLDAIDEKLRLENELKAHVLANDNLKTEIEKVRAEQLELETQLSSKCGHRERLKKDLETSLTKNG